MSGASVLDPAQARTAARSAIAAIIKRTVRDDERLVSTGVIDSLSVLKLVLALEVELGKRIPTTNVQPEDLDSVDSIVETLGRVLGT